VQDDRLLRSKHRAGSDAKDEGITDLAGGAGNSDSNGSRIHKSNSAALYEGEGKIKNAKSNIGFCILCVTFACKLTSPPLLRPKAAAKSLAIYKSFYLQFESKLVMLMPEDNNQPKEMRECKK
jgi:hypothetical protein